VTAVASAQGSAARRQPQQGQGRQSQVQAPRKGDAPVSLVGADESAGADGTAPVRQKGSRPRRSQRNAPKSVPAAGGGETAPAAGGPPHGRQGKQARSGGAENTPQDTAVAQDGAGEAAGLDENASLEEDGLDVVVTLEGVEDLDAVDLDEFAVDVDVDVDLEVEVDIEEGPDDIDVAECQDTDAARELLAYIELGLCAPEDLGRMVDEGTTAMGGRIPVNPSGGLLSKGEPLGASAIGQVVELTHQLQGTCGTRQVEGARVALAQTVGRGANASVTILSR